MLVGTMADMRDDEEILRSLQDHQAAPVSQAEAQASPLWMQGAPPSPRILLQLVASLNVLSPACRKWPPLSVRGPTWSAPPLLSMGSPLP